VGLAKILQKNLNWGTAVCKTGSWYSFDICRKNIQTNLCVEMYMQVNCNTWDKS